MPDKPKLTLDVAFDEFSKELLMLMGEGWIRHIKEALAACEHPTAPESMKEHLIPYVIMAALEWLEGKEILIPREGTLKRNIDLSARRLDSIPATWSNDPLRDLLEEVKAHCKQEEEE